MEDSGVMKKLHQTLVAKSIVETFNELCQASHNESPEIRAFVESYENKLIAKGHALAMVFGEL